MIQLPPPQALQAIERLRGSDDFEKVRGWLQASLEELRQRAQTEDSIRTMRRLQGAAQTLSTVLEATESGLRIKAAERRPLPRFDSR